MKIDVVIGEDEFSKQISKQINAKFIKIETTVFPDSEVKPTLKIENDIRNNNILLVSRTNRFKPRINDSIMKTFFIVSLLNEIGTNEINLLIPYMFYSRQDKQFLPGEPKSMFDVAEMYENLHISNIFAINSHLYGKETSLQKYFKKIKIHDISPSKLFSEYLKTKNLKIPLVLGSDTGPAIMVKELSELLNTSSECLEKERNHKTLEITMKPPKSDLLDRDVIIYDDVAASGGTIVRTFELAKQLKPNRIFIVLSHLITKKGIEKLYNLNSSEIITTDSFISEKPKSFTELTLVPLVSDYIKKL